MFYHYIIIIQVHLCHYGFVSLQYNATPLHKASGNGHKAIFEVLLEAGTNSVNKFIQSRISFMYCKNMIISNVINIIIN